jgi:iron(III) transport system substrate-binding protein
VRIRSLVLGVVGLALGGGVLGACGGSSGAAETITVYNGQHPQTTAALVSAFQDQTGIRVLVRNGDEDVFANQILAEGPHSRADVFIAENSPALEFLSTKELLSAVAPSTLNQVPARYRSPQSRWVGVAARVSVMIYNTELLRRADLPTSVLQLADPRWQGKLALSPGETDFKPVVTSVINSIGPAGALRWLEALKANAASHIYPDSEAISAMVNSGQAEIGIINQYYWYRLRIEVGASDTHSAIAYFAPHDPGYVLNVSGAAVLRSSRHQAAAAKFLAFLTSRQGQEIIARSDSFEYPVGSGVVTAHAQTPLDQLQPAPISIAQLGDGTAALALLQKAQLL